MAWEIALSGAIMMSNRRFDRPLRGKRRHGHQGPEDGPAAKQDIKAGDVIVAVNGDKIDDSRDLARKIAELHPNTNVKLSIVRYGDKHEVDMKLGTFPSGRRRGGAGRDGMATERETTVPGKLSGAQPARTSRRIQIRVGPFAPLALGSVFMPSTPGQLTCY